MHVTVQCIIPVITRVLLKSNYSLYFSDTLTLGSVMLLTLAVTQLQMLSTDIISLLVPILYFSQLLLITIIYKYSAPQYISIFDCAFTQ